jgi:hypothetical protein
VGEKPIVKVHQRYEWTYLYAFAHPKTGEVYWLILPTVNAEAFSMALENFAKEMGAGNRKRIVLVLDQAGWHTAKEKLKVLKGIHLEFLPSHSPELQPSERLWPLSNEGVQPPLRADRGPGGGARGALRGFRQPAGGHLLAYPLPLVGRSCMKSKPIYPDLLLMMPVPSFSKAQNRNQAWLASANSFEGAFFGL